MKYITQFKSRFSHWTNYVRERSGRRQHAVWSIVPLTRSDGPVITRSHNLPFTTGLWAHNLILQQNTRCFGVKILWPHKVLVKWVTGYNGRFIYPLSNIVLIMHYVLWMFSHIGPKINGQSLKNGWPWCQLCDSSGCHSDKLQCRQYLLQS